MKIISLSISILLSTSIYGQKFKNDIDLSDLNLKGNVLTLIEFHYKVIDSLQEIRKGDMKLKTVSLFNENGVKYAETETIYSYNTFSKWKRIFKYDVKGNVIESFQCNPDGSSNYTGKRKYQYDSIGNKNEERFYAYDSIFAWKRTYKYDSKMNLIEWRYFRANDSLSCKGIYKYDGDSNLIEWKYIDGEQDSKETYKYNENGKRIEANFYKSNNIYNGKSTFKYDANGNNIEINSYKANGNLSMKSTFKYDDKGNEIEMDIPSKNIPNRKYTYIYIYDRYNNWVKKTELIDGVPKSIIEREIEYY